MKIKKVIIVLIVVLLLGLVSWAFFNIPQPTSQPSPTGQTQPEAALGVELRISRTALEAAKETKVLNVSVATTGKAVGVKYMLDGTEAARSVEIPLFRAAISLANLEKGQHTLQAVVNDMDGNLAESEEFVFMVEEDDEVVPADETSENIISRISGGVRQVGNVTSPDSSGGGQSGDNNGGDNGGDPDPDPDPDPDTTPWPDAPPALVCGNTSMLSGPTSAPAGAVVVPAGDNDDFDFDNPNTTYWFAPGTHTLGASDPDGLHQIIPSNNSTYIGAPGAILDGENHNKYAFTQHAINVKVQYLTIQNFEAPHNEGVVNHDSGTGWTIEYNTIQNNSGGGVFAGSDNVIRYNCLRDNGQYGFQVYSSAGPTNVLLDHNEVSGNNTGDWETVEPGCGCTGGGKFWEATNVTVTNNYVHDNLSVGLWADTNDNDFLIEGNYIEGNDGQGLFYEISYNMIVRNNNFIRNALVDGPGNPGFPTGAIYLSEAGGDSRVPGRTDSIDIYDNQFVDNWAGVILWENADRYCNSPANTSTGTCTIVNPDADLTTCNDPDDGGSIDEAPYYSDCRWKTQNVKVHDNVFSMDRADIPNCTTGNSCGFQGIFSNVGTFPDWSPYMGSVIQEDITFNQNNQFSNNTYEGDWRFKTISQDTLLNFAIWQGAPYQQDTGSTFNGESHLTVANALDDNTATLEGSLGEWAEWFSTTISRTTEEAHSGTHSLRVNIDAPFGWGVFTDAAEFPVTPVDKTVSFWAKLGAGTNLGVNMQVVWIGDHPDLPITDIVPLSPLTNEWQQASAQLTPPEGADRVSIRFVNSTGTAGNFLYLDDIIVADNEAWPQ